MFQQSATLTHYTLSLLARAFAWHNRYHQIHIDNNNINLVSRLGSRSHISFIDLGQHISISDGYFWSTLVIDRVNNRPLKLGGIKKAMSGDIVNLIQQNSYHAQQAYFSGFQSDIKRGYQALLALVKSHHYIRRNDIEDWFNSYQILPPVVTHPNINRFLNEEFQHYVAAVKQVFEQGKPYFDDFNDDYITQQLTTYKAFFDTVESQPLTPAQREACVKNEQANLVLAGAGTGKTSTMIGRAGYLIESELATPSQILMLAFGNDAAKEMAERLKTKINIEGFTTKTFHSLGMHIITQVEGKPPVFNKMATDERLKLAFIEQQFKDLMKDKEYRNVFINYFSVFNHASINPHDFHSLSAYNHAIKTGQLRTLQGELVKSTEECDIANFLFKKGIQYQYEAHYPFSTENAAFRQYQPDFYLTDYGIYIEHFAIDEHGKTPRFIDQSSYAEGMIWKRQLHEQHATPLIETYSYQKRKGILLKELASSLKQHGVVFQPLSYQSLFTKLKDLGSISKFTQLIAQLMSQLKSSHLQLDSIIKNTEQSNNFARLNIAHKLISPIIDAYEATLKNDNSIDFDDLILTSISYLKSGKYRSNYTHILVDEFQDISPSRAELLLALRQSISESTLFCVGDDWQSIYQFSGSQVEITQKFEHYFGHTALSVLDTTFRFNNKIGDVATSFVLKNPDQLTKQIHSLTQTSQTAITVINSSTDTLVALNEALNAISVQIDTRCSVLILVRFNHDKPQLSSLKSAFPQLNITVMSIHASKGKEADFVVVLGLNKGEFGFPPEKPIPPLLSLFNPTEHSIEYAEERRVFYVALTRAKHHVYLVTNAEKSSSFIHELLNDDYDVICHRSNNPAIQHHLAKAPCPECKIGYLLVKHDSAGRQYLQCNETPHCQHQQALCEQCHAELHQQGQFNSCTSPNCNYKEPICPACGSTLIKRNGEHGEFWGCKNYRSSDATSCSYKTNTIELNKLS